MKKTMCLVAVMLMATFAGAQTDNLNGSTVVLDSFTYNSDSDVDLVFSALQVTTSAEWFDGVTINLPAGWSIVSLSSTNFDTTAGVGTTSAQFSFSGGPCSGFGIDCDPACVLNVKVDTGGNTAPGVPATWMVYGDTWGAVPDSVMCSVNDPCAADACYAALGTDATGADVDLGTVPVELMSLEVE